MQNPYNELLSQLKANGIYGDTAHIIADAISLGSDVFTPAEVAAFTDRLKQVKKAIQQALINCAVA